MYIYIKSTRIPYLVQSIEEFVLNVIWIESYYNTELDKKSKLTTMKCIYLWISIYVGPCILWDRGKNGVETFQLFRGKNRNGMKIWKWKCNFAKRKLKYNFFWWSRNRIGTTVSGGTNTEIEFPFPTDAEFPFSSGFHGQSSKPNTWPYQTKPPKQPGLGNKFDSLLEFLGFLYII
jgi:hypothetical protein